MPPLTHFVLITAAAASALRMRAPPPPPRRLRAPSPRSAALQPIDIQILQRKFASVRELPRVQTSLKGATTRELLDVDDYAEPSFRRLFTHKTWTRYIGGGPLARVWRLLVNWRHDMVLGQTWPCILGVTWWALLVNALLRASPALAAAAEGLSTTLQLQGTAIGLLVFRTDNAYRRCGSSTVGARAFSTPLKRG